MNDSRDESKGDGGFGIADVAKWFEAARTADDATERAEVLQSIPGEELRREVEKLLGHHESEGVLSEDEGLEMRRAALDGAVDAVAPTQVGEVGEAVGDWELLRSLGQGGMGTVWLGRRQTTEFVQEAAVKILRAELDGGEGVRRFRMERRILAGLQHPNIARFLDGGTMANGSPFVVMEFVDGADLLSWAHERAFNVRQRLGLFRKVCSAVEHAHAALVVHRDLKPSNILVARDSGEPKLLDFGIAKLLGEGDAKPSRTMTGMLVLTPEYASPEQVRGSELVNTSTDIYALGLLLYELLTGVRAQQLDTVSATELARVVCETDPPSPSTAVMRRGGDERVSVRLRKQLTGDLDAIVMKAIRKEPEHRYASVAEFSEDLRRVLEGLPVRARRGSAGYRAARFVRRNRTKLTAALLVLVVAIGSAIGFAVQAERLREQRDLARRQTRVASDVADFMVDVFQLPETETARAERLTARDLLDVGARRIRADKNTDPLLRASLMVAMGRAFRALGQFDEAEDLLVEARDLRLDARPIAQIESLVHLGQLRLAQGRYEDAFWELDVAAAKAEAMLSAAEDEEGRAEGELWVGSVARAQAYVRFEFGQFDDLDPLIERARGFLLRSGRREARKGVADCRLLSGRVALERGDLDRAESATRQAIEQFRELDKASEAESMRTLAEIQKERGQLQEALETYRAARVADEAAFGEFHPVVDSDRYGEAAILKRMDRFEEAQTLLEGVVERERERYGAHPYTALAIGELAGVHSLRGDDAIAIPLYEEALTMQRATLDPEHLEIATTLSNLGVAWRRNREIEKAAVYFEEALEIRRQSLPDDHPTVLTSRSLMALVLLERGDLDRAAEEYEAVYAGREAALGLHPETAGALYSLAVVDLRRGQLESAERRARRSADIYRQIYSGQTTIDVTRPLRLLGTVMMRSNRADEAEPVFKEVVDVCRNLLDPAHFLRTGAERGYARCLAALERIDEAKSVYDGVIEALRAELPSDHPELQAVEAERAQLK